MQLKDLVGTFLASIFVVLIQDSSGDKKVGSITNQLAEHYSVGR